MHFFFFHIFLPLEPAWPEDDPLQHGVACVPVKTSIRGGGWKYCGGKGGSASPPATQFLILTCDTHKEQFRWSSRAEIYGVRGGTCDLIPKHESKRDSLDVFTFAPHTHEYCKENTKSPRRRLAENCSLWALRVTEGGSSVRNFKKRTILRVKLVVFVLQGFSCPRQGIYLRGKCSDLIVAVDGEATPSLVSSRGQVVSTLIS